jgi:hypothetical protein
MSDPSTDQSRSEGDPLEVRSKKKEGSEDRAPRVEDPETPGDPPPCCGAPPPAPPGYAAVAECRHEIAQRLLGRPITEDERETLDALADKHDQALGAHLGGHGAYWVVRAVRETHLIKGPAFTLAQVKNTFLNWVDMTTAQESGYGRDLPKELRSGQGGGRKGGRGAPQPRQEVTIDHAPAITTPAPQEPAQELPSEAAAGGLVERMLRKRQEQAVGEERPASAPGPPPRDPLATLQQLLRNRVRPEDYKHVDRLRFVLDGRQLLMVCKDEKHLMAVRAHKLDDVVVPIIRQVGLGDVHPMLIKGRS